MRRGVQPPSNSDYAPTQETRSPDRGRRGVRRGGGAPGGAGRPGPRPVRQRLRRRHCRPVGDPPALRRHDSRRAAHGPRGGRRRLPRTHLADGLRPSHLQPQPSCGDARPGRLGPGGPGGAAGTEDRRPARGPPGPEPAARATGPGSAADHARGPDVHGGPGLGLGEGGGARPPAHREGRGRAVQGQVRDRGRFLRAGAREGCPDRPPGPQFAGRSVPDCPGAPGQHACGSLRRLRARPRSAEGPGRHGEGRRDVGLRRLGAPGEEPGPGPRGLR